MKETWSLVTLLSMFAIASMFAGWQAANQQQTPIVLKVESPYSLEETIDNIRQAVAARNFRLIREQSLSEGLVPGEAPSPHIIYFCNFSVAYQSLQQDKQIGFLLPCRLTVGEEDGRVFISAINPRAVEKFADTKAAAVCDNIGDGYLGIMEEATL